MAGADSEDRNLVTRSPHPRAAVVAQQLPRPELKLFPRIVFAPQSHNVTPTGSANSAA